MIWLERLLCVLVRHDWVNAGEYRFCVNCDAVQREADGG